MKRFVLVFGLAVLWLGGLAFSAYGFAPLFDDRLSISGYVQNQSSYRVGGDHDQLVSSENRLQVEVDAKLHPNVTVYGVFRGIYDAAYDLRHDSDRWCRDYAGSRDILSTEASLREFYTDIALGRWDFRIGKQQVVWGETDGLRLMDIINPLDMRRQFSSRDWRDIRIPLTMVKAVYGIDTTHNAFLELLWNPGDIRRDKLYADTTMSDDYKSPWTIPNSPATLQIQGLRSPNSLAPWVSVPTSLAVGEEDTPEWINVNKSEFGGRLAGELGGWFVTLNYWQGFSKTPVVNADLRPLEPALGYMATAVPPPPFGPPVNPATFDQAVFDSLLPSLPVNFRFEYPRERVVGFTFNKATGMWVWRGEFATHLDKHYNKTEMGFFMPHIMIAERTVESSMLGFDYKTWIPFLNPEKMWFISAQVFYDHIFGYDKELQDGPYSQKCREDSLAYSLMINTEYHMGRICPEVLVVYHAATTGWYAKPRVEFKYGDHWRPEIGGLVYCGQQYELPFGAVKDNDEIYFRLKYQF
ncbi:MAG: hypothetical protein COX51_00105 [Syntrophobacteraceae bacterium CG23_combo_of_CG06-09_8_20_14_all_50_8]|nr:MAG: hypothetical protein COX51_00105 [Syntrophobacteraceae bacterium CG23_combo_of_CG06-09_8_20_14_all_50_8]